MTETERYLFDVRGYLVVPGALSEEEVDEINHVIDGVLPSWQAMTKTGYIIAGWDEESTQGVNDSDYGPEGFNVAPLLDWGEPIRKLVGQKKVLPYLKEMMGPTLRLDHGYAVLMKAKCSPLVLHGGGAPYSASEYYHFRDNRFFCGLTVASFSLCDIPPGSGGFCCIPGSHKANLPLPRQFRDLVEPAECVVQIPLRKGDAVLFSENLTHGTLQWRESYERRAVLFNYCPGHIQYAKDPPIRSSDYEWEDHQKALLRPPSWLIDENAGI